MRHYYFTPATVSDKASFDKGLAFSEGIEYVIVNGVVVLKNGKTVPGISPAACLWKIQTVVLPCRQTPLNINM